MANDTLPAEVLRHLREGRKIEAVKELRAARGAGLAEAHTAITAAIANDPLLARQYANDVADQRRGAIRVLLVALGLVALAAWLVLVR